MIGMDFKTARSMFLDSPKVERRVAKAKRKTLSKQGWIVRRVAKKLIPGPKQKFKREMTVEETERYDRKAKAAKRLGKPRPKRPMASSAPGDPPRSQTGLLKKLILYVYDPRLENVIIGPARVNAKGRDVPSRLEFGGGGIAARPYMGPALEKAQPQFAKMWRDSVK